MKEFIKSILKLSPIALSKNHLYDRQTKLILRKVLSSQSNCIDVGCHKGEILDLMLKNAPKGRHFGFEPIPVLYDNLQKKYEQHENCTIQNVAISKVAQQKVQFNYVVSNPSYSGLIKRKYDKSNEKDTTIEVETDTLDRIIPETLKIDLLKIDVEGGELLVLQGAKALVKRDRPYVIFEHGLGASEFYGATPEQIFQYFQDAQMQIATLSSFLRKKTALSAAAFQQQFYERKNYYFIAFGK